MKWDEQKAREAEESFQMSDGEIRAVSEAFRAEIGRGLRHETSSLKLLPSYLGMPTGKEEGEYITLDFGGTNVRADRVRLLGDGRYEMAARVAKPLLVPGKYNHLGGGETAAGLFAFLAEIIDSLVAGDRETPYRLGHTFSFPSEQTSLGDARLMHWTKELSVSDVEGEWVNRRLEDALTKRGLTNIRPVAILNDTVAALLAAGYERGDIAVGSIYATGFNICYLEDFGGEKPSMVLNLEAGGFDKVETNGLDRALDAASEQPGTQRFEKMVSGRYLGELFALAMGSVVGERLPAVSGKDIASVAEGTDTELLARMTGEEFSDEQAAEAVAVARAIVRRSARLVAAAYVGVLRHRAGQGKSVPAQTVAVEGSFFANVPLARATLRDTMRALLGDGEGPAEIADVVNGASLGAAIAAAMAK